MNYDKALLMVPQKKEIKMELCSQCTLSLHRENIRKLQRFLVFLEGRERVQ